MTHLPYIVSVYLMGVLVPVAYAVDAMLRSRRAIRLLAVAEAGGRRVSRGVTT